MASSLYCLQVTFRLSLSLFQNLLSFTYAETNLKAFENKNAAGGVLKRLGDRQKIGKRRHGAIKHEQDYTKSHFEEAYVKRRDEYGNEVHSLMSSKLN